MTCRLPADVSSIPAGLYLLPFSDRDVPIYCFFILPSPIYGPGGLRRAFSFGKNKKDAGSLRRHNQLLIHLVDEGYQFFFDKCGIVHPVPSLKSGLYLLSRAAFATDFFKFSSESGRTFCPFCQPFSAIFLTKKETGTCFSSSSLSVILI